MKDNFEYIWDFAKGYLYLNVETHIALLLYLAGKRKFMFFEKGEIDDEDLDKIKDFDDIIVKYHECTFITRNIKLLNEFLELDRKDLGDFLGYPKCCIAFYTENKMSDYNLYSHIQKMKKRFPYCLHIPCSEKCEESAKMDRENGRLMFCENENNSCVA